MQTMLAARYLGPNRLEPEEIPLPVIGNEEALVQVEACGFCGSDISFVAGTHPRATPALSPRPEPPDGQVLIRTSPGALPPGARVTTRSPGAKAPVELRICTTR